MIQENIQPENTPKKKKAKTPTAFGYKPTRKTAYWRVEYLKQLAKRNTPDLICHELGYCYSSIKQARNEPEFKEAEEYAKRVYQDKMYEKILDDIEEYPALKLKLAERIIPQLRQEAPVINIDQSHKKITLLGMPEEQIYAHTKMLLKAVGSQEKLLENKSNVSGAFIDIESKAIKA
jgi:hypothetical protein